MGGDEGGVWTGRGGQELGSVTMPVREFEGGKDRWFQIKSLRFWKYNSYEDSKMNAVV